MPLADKFMQAKTVRKGPLCTVGAMLSSMTPEDRDAVNQALNTPMVTSRTIWRVLVEEGYNISDTPIARHRRGMCLCSRKDLQI